MSSTGINWQTGQILRDWPHVCQSIVILFTTPIGARVMRRAYGSMGWRLLGEPLREETLDRFVQVITAAIEINEPRFSVTAMEFRRDLNSPETARLGHLLGIRFVGQYRPRGHLGDFTPERGERELYVGLPPGGITVI